MKKNVESQKITIQEQEAKIKELGRIVEESKQLQKGVSKLELKIKELEEDSRSLANDQQVIKRDSISYENSKSHKKFNRLTGCTIQIFEALISILKGKEMRYEFGWKVKIVSFEDQMLIFF